jgi:hypothetical protein
VGRLTDSIAKLTVRGQSGGGSTDCHASVVRRKSRKIHNRGSRNPPCLVEARAAIMARDTLGSSGLAADFLAKRAFRNQSGHQTSINK